MTSDFKRLEERILEIEAVLQRVVPIAVFDEIRAATLKANQAPQGAQQEKP